MFSSPYTDRESSATPSGSRAPHRAARSSTLNLTHSSAHQSTARLANCAKASRARGNSFVDRWFRKELEHARGTQARESSTVPAVSATEKAAESRLYARPIGPGRDISQSGLS